jgi:peptide/nickel transport system substrate-binding protein
MFKKGTIVILLVCLATSLVMAGCSNNQTAKKDEIVIAQGVDATTLDPHMHAETPTANVIAQMFDRLLVRDINGELQPQLATSVEAVNDTTWEVKLRDDVKFHNGEAFNAETVKFNIDRILNPDNRSPQIADLSAIQEVKVIDEFTVHIITKAPYPVLPGRLNLPMVPKQYIEEKGAQYFATNPVGTGPYKFVSWTKDESVVMEANEEYWRSAPAIKKVTFKPVPESSTRIAELQTGAVDIIVNVPPHQASTINTGASTKIASTASGRFIFISMNTVREGPLANKLVRQAMNYAVDVDSIIENVLGGYGYKSTQPLTTKDFGYDATIPGFQYNPEKAKSLLVEAGYPNGIEIDLGSPSGRYVMDKEVAEAVVGQLAAVGIKANIKVQEWGVYVGKIMEKKVEEAYLIGWGSSLFDADATLFPWFRTGQRFSTYEVPAVDALLDQARSVISADERKALYSQAMAIITEDAPFLLLYQQEDLYGVNKNLNWTPRPDEMIFVYDMSFTN